MSCDRVRAALVAGDSLDPFAEHLAACPACGALAAVGPREVTHLPPTPNVTLFRRRARRDHAALAGLGIAALVLAGLLLSPSPTPPTGLSAAPTEVAEAGDTADFLTTADQLARVDLGRDFDDEPFDDVAPLAAFDDPTDLLTIALLGEGSP